MIAQVDGRLLDHAGALIDSLGGSGFNDAVERLLDDAAALDQFIVFAVPDSGEAECLHAWNRTAPALAADLAARYVSGGFHRRDTALNTLRRPQAPRLRLVGRGDIFDADYRRQFFDAPGLGGKLSVLGEAPGKTLYVNFYKSAAEATFSDREVANLCALTGMVGKSILRHRAMTRHARPDAAAVRAILARRCHALTARELDVCARIVTGYTSEAIGLDLGISESSVATYRKRAYAKLGICSQHDLFALCLSAH